MANIATPACRGVTRSTISGHLALVRRPGQLEAAVYTDWQLGADRLDGQPATRKSNRQHIDREIGHVGSPNTECDRRFLSAPNVRRRPSRGNARGGLFSAPWPGRLPTPAASTLIANRSDEGSI